MTEPHRIDERLRQRRVQVMLTQEELAERAGVDARTVRDIETGRTKNPRPSTVRLLLDALTDAENNRATGVEETRRPVRPRELPPDTFGFTGRDEQLAELDRLHDLSARHPTAPAIVALSGTAGVGKTSLAVHWAHHSLDRFPDGQLYLNLRGYDADHPVRPTEALAALLRSLGMSGAEIPPDQDDRARLYRTLVADLRILILLDNALNVDQIRDLLPGAATSFVLVTSRDSLGGLVVRHGGRLVEVPPLSQPEAQALLKAHIGDRAGEAPATAALANQCARLPLALRIAAQRAAARPAVTLAELVTELADEHQRLDLLDSGEPHSSARAVFSWSYRQLPDDMARLFRLLGIQPGRDIDLHALAELAGTDLRQARRQVSGLVRAHLIDETARDRFTMHDLLRMYAKQQADDEDQADVRDAALTRLFDYYLNAASHAMAKFAPYEEYRPELPAQTSALPDLDSRDAAVTWLDAERANLVAVGLHAAAHGWPSHTSRLSAVLHRYLSIGAHWADSALLHRAAIDTDDAGPGLANYGTVLMRLGRLQEALEHFQRAADLLRDGGGSRRDEARVLGNLAVLHSRLGHQREAMELNHRALDVFRGMGESFLEAISLENLGVVYQRLGNYQESYECQRRALALYEKLDDPVGEAGVRGNIGVTCSQLGRHEEALEHQQRALAILRVIGDRHHEAETLNDIGTTLRLAGSPRQAIERHQQALARAAAIGDRYDQAGAHEGAALCYRDLGDLDTAREHWQAALELHTELGTAQADRIAATIRDLDG